MRTKKRFGQHFLTDNTIAAKIVTAAQIEEGDNVWEIGPGKGVLTDLLIGFKCRLTCFEIDRDLIPYLNNRYDDRIILVNQDILQVDWKEMLDINNNVSPLFIDTKATDNPHLNSHKNQQTTLVANIPYNITSPILEKLCQHSGQFQVAVLMLQKEVAERISSKHGNKSYGVLSLKIQHYFDVKRLFNVPANRFRPQPQVDSQVVKLTPRTDKPTFFQREDLEYFWNIVETSFKARRKMLRNNLKTILTNEELQKLDAFLTQKEYPFSLKSRAEDLSEEDYIHLCDAILSVGKHNS